VTALYEITPVGSKALPVDHLHSGLTRASRGTTTDEIATLRVVYKLPDESRFRTLTRMVENRDIHHDFAKLSPDLRFAAAVAAAGQLLRHDPYTKSFDYGRVLGIAESAKAKTSSAIAASSSA
jgi:Ca-activated chloride channel family protein